MARAIPMTEEIDPFARAGDKPRLSHMLADPILTPRCAAIACLRAIRG